MPETKKKPKKPRAKRAVKSKKGLKQKQKQRQQVNVNVSAGGSGGGGYIPIPQAPEINYSLLSQLIRPAATVDVPIRAAAPVPEPVFVRPAEPETLASEIKPKRKYTKKPKPTVVKGFVSETESEPIDLREAGKREAELLLKYAPEGSEFVIKPATRKKGSSVGGKAFEDPSARGGGFGEE